MDSTARSVETDEELISQYHLAPDAAESGQLVAELWRRHHHKVLAWCGRLTGDRDLAPDLAQDVFVRAYSALCTFRRGAKFTTWLYVIARNRCLDEQRARAAGAREATGDAALCLACDWNGGVAALDARDARTIVRGLMDAVLDDTEKRVMILHYAHDVPLGTITAALGLSNASGAKAFIVSARRKLTSAVKRWNVQSRKAIAGSVDAARSAGTRHAPDATVRRTAAAATCDVRASGVIPHNTLLINRVSPSAVAMPAARPPIVSASPSPSA